MPDTGQRRDGSPGYLAIDLGAGSGRAFLGSLDAGLLNIREIHRFANEPLHCGTSIRWNTSKLWREIQAVFPLLEDFGGQLAGIGVDAWGVDYALLGPEGELLRDPLHYRDPRNIPAMDAVLARMPKADIYRRTGVQFMPINTLYQLFAARCDSPELLARARHLVMVPDLFRYWLTGRVACEYTIASTTQFANPVTRDWDRDLLAELGLPKDLPAEISEPGSIAGGLLAEVSPTYRGTPVIFTASHDTASAVAAVEARDQTAFLSSGTWSLLGIEIDQPILTEQARRFNFTNEGGVCGTTRLLKNVTGLWLLEECRRQWPAQSSRDALTQAASDAPAFRCLVDPDHASFLNPPSMASAIDDFCDRNSQPHPESPGAYARTIMESLALKYRMVLRDLETLIGRSIERLRVIGGGSRNRLLNQFTADATGVVVIAGPTEATVLGNIGIQLLATGEVNSLGELRAMIDRSFPVEIFVPRDREAWDRQADRFQQYCEIQYA